MGIGDFFNLVLYQPLFNILILLYTYLPGHDFGVAVIVLTLIIKLILLPTSLKAVRSQRIMADLQPKLKEIQEKYKDNKEKQSQEIFKLYQKTKTNPFSGCLPLLLQLPVLIALYQVFLKGFKNEILESTLYSFVPYSKSISLMFLGIIDLSQPNFFLALIAGILQFIQSKISMPKKTSDKKDTSQMIQSQMTYFFPLLTVFIVWKFGSIIGLYWITSTLFSIGEYYLITKKMKTNA